MNNNKENNTDFENTLSFSDEVIEKIAGITVREIPGIISLKGNFVDNISEQLTNSKQLTTGINVEVGKKQASIDLKVVIAYGESAPKIFNKVIELVKEKVKFMTGLDVVEINMTVEDVIHKDEFESTNKVN